MKNIVYGLLYLNDLEGVLKYWSETEGDALFEEGRLKIVLRGVEVLLEAVYVLVVLVNKGISMHEFYVTAYIGICTASVISRAWKLYKSVREESKMKAKIREM